MTLEAKLELFILTAMQLKVGQRPAYTGFSVRKNYSVPPPTFQLSI